MELYRSQMPEKNDHIECPNIDILEYWEQSKGANSSQQTVESILKREMESEVCE
jgi:hypothetical protein